MRGHASVNGVPGGANRRCDCDGYRPDTLGGANLKLIDCTDAVGIFAMGTVLTKPMSFAALAICFLDRPEVVNVV